MLYKKHLNLEDRKNFPLNGPSNYRICENKVLTRAIEVNAVTHAIYHVKVAHIVLL